MTRKLNDIRRLDERHLLFRKLIKENYEISKRGEEIVGIARSGDCNQMNRIGSSSCIVIIRNGSMERSSVEVKADFHCDFQVSSEICRKLKTENWYSPN